MVIFITAFGESFAFLSLLFPGTTLLIAAGALIQTGDLSTWPIATGAVLGALLGDAGSYWIGRRLGSRLARVWPFTRHPDLLAGGVQFFPGMAARACSSVDSSARCAPWSRSPPG